MNPRKERFALEYAVGPNAGNKTQAAIAAGYDADDAGNQGYRLTKDDDVMALVESERERAVAPIRASAAWIVEKAANIADSTSETDPKTAIAALTLLSKRWPEFRDAVNIDNRTLNLSGLTPEDMESVLSALTAPQNPHSAVPAAAGGPESA